MAACSDLSGWRSHPSWRVVVDAGSVVRAWSSISAWRRTSDRHGRLIRPSSWTGSIRSERGWPHPGSPSRTMCSCRAPDGSTRSTRSGTGWSSWSPTRVQAEGRGSRHTVQESRPTSSVYPRSIHGRSGVTRTLFAGGRVFDGTGAALAEADVVVEDGTILSVGPGLDGDEVVECTGLAVLPGLFDCHTHVVISHIDYMRAPADPVLVPLLRGRQEPGGNPGRRASPPSATPAGRTWASSRPWRTD